jgi:hypothetical protein
MINPRRRTRTKTRTNVIVIPANSLTSNLINHARITNASGNNKIIKHTSAMILRILTKVSITVCTLFSIANI